MNRSTAAIRAFTLIELLIVVAIIAILAAIAVPNFLEAQTRSKVSRVKSDMRTLATGVESYAVDYGKPPIGLQEMGKWVPVDFGLTGPVVKWNPMMRLTTPVAYLASIPFDTFAEKGRLQADGGLGGYGEGAGVFLYQSYPGAMTRQGLNNMGPAYRNAAAMGVTWSLRSIGPSRRMGIYGSVDGSTTGNEAQYLAKMVDTATEARYPSLVYDSTNGTMSFGWIIRSNQGAAN